MQDLFKRQPARVVFLTFFFSFVVLSGVKADWVYSINNFDSDYCADGYCGGNLTADNITSIYGFFDWLCLGGTCIDTWPAGGSGSFALTVNDNSSDYLGTNGSDIWFMENNLNLTVWNLIALNNGSVSSLAGEDFTDEINSNVTMLQLAMSTNTTETLTSVDTFDLNNYSASISYSQIMMNNNLTDIDTWFTNNLTLIDTWFINNNTWMLNNIDTFFTNNNTWMLNSIDTWFTNNQSFVFNHPDWNTSTTGLLNTTMTFSGNKIFEDNITAEMTIFEASTNAYNITTNGSCIIIMDTLFVCN